MHLERGADVDPLCKRSPNLVCLGEFEEGARKRCKVTCSHALQASPRATDRYSAATIDHGLTSLHTTLFLFNTMIASALLLPLLARRVSAVSAGLGTLLFDAPAARGPNGALAVSAAVFTYRADARAGELERARAARAPASPPRARPPLQATPVLSQRKIRTRKATDGGLRSDVLAHACMKHPHISVHCTCVLGMASMTAAWHWRWAILCFTLHRRTREEVRVVYGVFTPCHETNLHTHQVAQVGDSRSSYMCTSSSRSSDTSGRSTFTTTIHGRTYSCLSTHYLRLCLTHDGDLDEDGLHLLVQADRQRDGVNEEHSVRRVRAAILNVNADTTRP
jgi:hypothetical protein